MDWETLIIQVLYVLIATFVPVLGLSLRALLARQKQVNELLLTEEWVESAVHFAEQTYGTLDGAEQYAIAAKAVSTKLAQYGIKISESQLKLLIDAAVYRMKEGWAEYEPEGPEEGDVFVG